MLAQGWLGLEITDSPFWVGAVAGLQGLGLVGFGAFGGTIVDRFDKRKVLATVHLIGGGMAFLTGALVITGYIELWHMLIISLIQGLLMATQLPASNSLAYQLVGPKRLLNVKYNHASITTPQFYEPFAQPTVTSLQLGDSSI